jgi:hypothetical protein
MLGLAVLGLVIFAFFVVKLLTEDQYNWLVGIDRGIYREAALRWLGGRWWFYPEQVAGPYEILTGHVLYPPAALIWFAPAALLPDLLWWVIPIGVTIAIVARHRPAPWTWPVMAACLAYGWTAQIIISGNPSLWIMASVAVGTIWRPAFALVLLKPSLFPLALIGVRSRGWWGVAATLVAVSLVLLPLTIEYAHVLLNARGPIASVLYSIRDIPLVAIPLIAWAGRQRNS